MDTITQEFKRKAYSGSPTRPLFLSRVPDASARRISSHGSCGKSTNHALIERCRGKLGAKYVICAEEFTEADGITYLPFYMAYCL